MALPPSSCFCTLWTKAFFYSSDVQSRVFDSLIPHTHTHAHTIVWPTETNPTYIFLFLAPNPGLVIIPHPCCNSLALQTSSQPQSLPGDVILVTKDDAELQR